MPNFPLSAFLGLYKESDVTELDFDELICYRDYSTEAFAEKLRNAPPESVSIKFTQEEISKIQTNASLHLLRRPYNAHVRIFTKLLTLRRPDLAEQWRKALGYFSLIHPDDAELISQESDAHQTNVYIQAEFRKLAAAIPSHAPERVSHNSTTSLLSDGYIHFNLHRLTRIAPLLEPEFLPLLVNNKHQNDIPQLFPEEDDKETHACRLDNGNVVIASSGVKKIVIVSPDGTVISRKDHSGSFIKLCALPENRFAVAAHDADLSGFSPINPPLNLLHIFDEINEAPTQTLSLLFPIWAICPLSNNLIVLALRLDQNSSSLNIVDIRRQTVQYANLYPGRVAEMARLKGRRLAVSGDRPTDEFKVYDMTKYNFPPTLTSPQGCIFHPGQRAYLERHYALQHRDLIAIAIVLLFNKNLNKQHNPFLFNGIFEHIMGYAFHAFPNEEPATIGNKPTRTEMMAHGLFYQLLIDRPSPPSGAAASSQPGI
jgi:hypothetical protein